MDAPYRAVRAVGRFWLWFLFKSIEVRHAERIPMRGPVLLAINHPNNLIDSLVVAAALDRKVHFLATAGLFKNRVLARFLAAMGAIPVYRRQDDPAQAARNTEAFEACFGALGQGEVIAIYPEGTTHAEMRVQRIKTGAARIALEAEARHDGHLGLTLVPVGLNFGIRKSFGSRVLVSFGEPIALVPYLPVYREDPFKAVDALTTVIQYAMEAEVIHVERMDLTALVREIEALYRADLEQELQDERGLAPRQIDPFRLSRAIADAVGHFSTHEPERLERIARRLAAYRALLAEYHVRDSAVRHRAGHRGARQRLAFTWQAIAGSPLFLYGAAVNALPYFIPRWLAGKLARKETDYATVRLLGSVVAFPLFWGLEIWAVQRLVGGVAAVVFALSLPVTGLLAFRYLGGLLRLRQAFRFTRLTWRHGNAARALMEERRAVLEELETAKAEYLAATHGSTF
jgi:glycerol-3-phosphate O-acyltransferase/dihydroxyacetone phosphate acyltransferase